MLHYSVFIIRRWYVANFKTHLQFSTVLSGMLSTAFLQQNILPGKETFFCWVAGSLGGILPDIDSDNSHSLSILFGALGFTAAALSTLYTVDQLPLWQVWGACAIAFLTVLFPVRFLFESMTVHRGIFHSLIAAIAMALAITCGLFQLGLTAKNSWFIGGFIGFGYVLHLLLDEIYAVDFSGAYIKRSFGSALKPVDSKNWPLSIMFIAICLLLLYLSPPYAGATKVFMQLF